MEQFKQKADVLFQTNASADFHQVLAPHPAVLRIVEQQVGQFPALLHQMDVRQPLDSFVEPRYANQFAERDPRVVETQGLVEIDTEDTLWCANQFPSVLDARGAQRLPVNILAGG